MAAGRSFGSVGVTYQGELSPGNNGGKSENRLKLETGVIDRERAYGIKWWVSGTIISSLPEHLWTWCIVPVIFLAESSLSVDVVVILGTSCKARRERAR